MCRQLKYIIKNAAQLYKIEKLIVNDTYLQFHIQTSVSFISVVISIINDR